jgi:hypothetical protein
LCVPLQAIPPWEVKERLKDCPGPPGMSMYNTTKQNAIKCEEIEKIRRELHEAVKGAKLTLVVGVNPKLERDDHIWDAIRNADGMVGLVDKAKLCEIWRRKYRTRRNDPILREKFMDAFSGICRLIDDFV